MRILLLAATVVLMAAACSSDDPVATAPPSVEPTVAATGSPVETQPPAMPARLAHLDQDVITVGGEDLLVVVARDSTDIAQGLMEVEDLGELDGMLFAYDRDDTGSFWMFRVPIALDIVWFDASGRFVSATRMVPCETDSPTGADCESYYAEGPYRFALELAAGDLDALGDEPDLDLSSLG